MPLDVPLDVGAGSYGVWRISGAPVAGGSEAFRLALTPVPNRPPPIIRITRYR